MRHSGNRSTIIDSQYELGGVVIRQYVYDELERFVTVTQLVLTKADLEHALNGIRGARELHAVADQPPLPPWQ